VDTEAKAQEEQTRNICKHAVKDCMQGAQFMNYREDVQIALFANDAYNKADYDKPDQEAFKKVWIAAYTKAQELLIGKPSPFSVRVLPSQLAQHMLWEEKMHESFDAAYVVTADRVEAAVGLSQESEVPS
jgi:hypothetical protein